MIRRLHVIPVGDLETHAAQETCWCYPVEVKENLWTHNAKDCREALERTAGITSGEWISIAEFIEPSPT